MARKTIRRWFWVWDFDKEELWLNEMARQGWVLDYVKFCTYSFVSCEPGEYTVRMELLENMANTEKGQEYIEFVEGTGVEYIGNMVRWVYFRKKAEDGSFELFSDIDSRISHLNRIINMVTLVGVANLLIGMNGLQYNLFALVNIGIAALLVYGAYRLRLKKKNLEQARMLRE